MRFDFALVVLMVSWTDGPAEPRGGERRPGPISHVLVSIDLVFVWRFVFRFPFWHRKMVFSSWHALLRARQLLSLLGTKLRKL